VTALTLKRSSFASADVAASLPVLESIYPKLALSSARPGGFWFEIESVDAGWMSTARFALRSPRSDGSADGTGTFSVTHLLAGNTRTTVGRDEVDFSRPFLAPARTFSSTWDEAVAGGIALDLPELRRFATQLAGRDTFQLAFTGVSPVNDALARFWTRNVTVLNRDLIRDEGAMTSPLVRRAAFEQMALAALRVFPNSLMELEPRRGPTRPVRSSIRRATTYIDEHLAAAITVADIAEASGLSVRGLTAAFHRELGTTPMGYLRAGRLDEVHRELQASDPGLGVTVAAVAHRWGFHNPGRFALAYRDRFGTTPVATLRG